MWPDFLIPYYIYYTTSFQSTKNIRTDGFSDVLITIIAFRVFPKLSLYFSFIVKSILQVQHLQAKKQGFKMTLFDTTFSWMKGLTPTPIDSALWYLHDGASKVRTPGPAPAPSCPVVAGWIPWVTTMKSFRGQLPIMVALDILNGDVFTCEKPSVSPHF